MDKQWEENKHPRDEDGKFTSDGGTTAEHEKLQQMGLENNFEVPVDITNLLGTEFKGYKGQNAVDKLLKEKQGHIKGAFTRNDIGNIDLIWGNEQLGLKHIITRREEQGIKSETFIKDIADVIEKGNFREKNKNGNFEFFYNQKVAVISPELYKNKITFLLTAFKTHSKK